MKNIIFSGGGGVTLYAKICSICDFLNSFLVDEKLFSFCHFLLWNLFLNWPPIKSYVVEYVLLCVFSIRKIKTGIFSMVHNCTY